MFGKKQSTMKEQYQELELEVIVFDAQDVITNSCSTDCEEDGCRLDQEYEE